MYTASRMGATKTTQKSTKRPRPVKSSPARPASKSFLRRHRILARWLVGGLAGIAILAIGIYTAFHVSPWPDALAIRWAFSKNDAQMAKALEKHVPKGVAAIENQQYRPDDKDGYLDVFYPEATTGDLPTVIWVHGGAWVSGDKDNIDNYLRILASKGFTVVGVDYSVAPGAKYPKPLLQLNDALEYLQKDAHRLHIDPDRLFLAGDSAGSQIVAQMANMITSPGYASQVGIEPELKASKLKGMLLNCGAYDLSLADYNGPFGGFLHTVLWAYSGQKDFLADQTIKFASVANYLTKDFPPAFITAGNIDPLLEQSIELARRLQALKVPTSTLFYAADHQPQLNHEYQFNLDLADGQKAMEQMVAFVRQYSGQ